MSTILFEFLIFSFLLLHIWVLTSLFFGPYSLESVELDAGTNEHHEEETAHIGPVPWIDVVEETFLEHLGHCGLVVIMSSICCNSPNHGIGSECDSGKDHGSVKDEESKDSACNDNYHNRCPE